MRPEKIIEINRIKIDKITKEMVRLIHKRDAAVKKITRAKIDLGLKMVDKNRERKLIQKVRRIAKKSGVDPDLMEKVTTVLILHSRGLL